MIITIDTEREPHVYYCLGVRETSGAFLHELRKANKFLIEWATEQMHHKLPDPFLLENIPPAPDGAVSSELRILPAEHPECR